jgi:hypothetical protein
MDEIIHVSIVMRLWMASANGLTITEALAVRGGRRPASHGSVINGLHVKGLSKAP